MKMKRMLRYSPPIAVALMILGAFLFDIPGLGTGEQDSEQESSSSLSNVQVSADGSAGKSLIGKSANETSPAPPKPLEILIDDREYRLPVDRDDVASGPVVELAEVVKQAADVAADGDRKRVVIRRRENARFTAEKELREALIAAGITEEQQQWVKELVP